MSSQLCYENATDSRMLGHCWQNLVISSLGISQVQHRDSRIFEKMPNRHQCSECPYTTRRRTNLVRHCQAMHSQADRRLECCGTLFASKFELRRHVRHQHDSGYSCTQCGRVFCRRALLKRHMSVHSGIKEFTCRECNYASSHKSNLERHQRVHLKGDISPKLKRKDDLDLLKTTPQKTPRAKAIQKLKIDKVLTYLSSLYFQTEAPCQKYIESASDETSNLNLYRMCARPYKCRHCNQRYQSQEAFIEHERALHPGLEVKALLSLPITRMMQLVRLSQLTVPVGELPIARLKE